MIINMIEESYIHLLKVSYSINYQISHPKILFYIFLFYILEFSYIDLWFNAQNSKLPEIERKINITLVINWHATKKNDTFSFEPRDRILVKILTKVQVKTEKINRANDFFIMLNNLQQMHLKLPKKYGNSTSKSNWWLVIKLLTR